MTEFYDFNEKLIVNMKYSRMKLADIYGDYPNVKKAYLNEEVIDGEEGEFIKRYISGIGGTDAATQVDYLNGMKAELSKYMSKCEEEYQKYGSMYFKLCLAGGVLIAVLLA